MAPLDREAAARIIDPEAFRELKRGWTWDNEDWEDWQGRLAHRRVESLSKADQIVALAAAIPGSAEGDTARLDWLEMRIVNVRRPLPHGSLNVFWSRPDGCFEGEERPSDIRARIDANRSLEAAETTELQPSPREDQ